MSIIQFTVGTYEKGLFSYLSFDMMSNYCSFAQKYSKLRISVSVTIKPSLIQMFSPAVVANYDTAICILVIISPPKENNYLEKEKFWRKKLAKQSYYHLYNFIECRLLLFHFYYH